MSEANIDNKNLQQPNIKERDVSVYAYDIAVVNDFRARFKQPPITYSDVNSNVIMSTPDQAFRILGEMSNDNIVMPFISIQRLSWQLNLDRQMSQTFVGDKVVIQNPDNPKEKLEVRAQVIPITINWQLDVWTRDRITNDALVREILWYYHLRPTLLVRVLHGLNMLHTFNIMFNSEIEDNSDIYNSNNKGNIVRSTLTFYSEDCYLWKAHHEPIVGIDVNTNFYYDAATKEYEELYGVGNKDIKSITGIDTLL